MQSSLYQRGRASPSLVDSEALQAPKERRLQAEVGPSSNMDNVTSVTNAFLTESSSWLSWYRGVLDVADRLPVVVRFPAGPRVRLKTVDPPKGNGLGQKKGHHH